MYTPSIIKKTVNSSGALRTRTLRNWNKIQKADFFSRMVFANSENRRVANIIYGRAIGNFRGL